MQFGPLELQAVGENNFSMKALGLLVYRPELRRRLLTFLLGTDIQMPPGEEISMLFFTRIGECFFREAIEREQLAGRGASWFEDRCNKALGLPVGFRWRRNANRKLTMPSKWKVDHIEQMLERNGHQGDALLKSRLLSIQDDLNTEPDLVLQWGRELALIEIKVLSGEGTQQMARQQRLGDLLADLLGWKCHYYLLAPEHGRVSSSTRCRFLSWKQVADLFDDVPEVASYIRGFAFYYRGAWQSMVAPSALAPGRTAYDLFLEQQGDSVDKRSNSTIEPGPEDPSVPRPTGGGASLPSTNTPSLDSWHFSHLGADYFAQIFSALHQAGFWPVKFVWTGRTGEPYANKAAGRKINPNWMVEGPSGERRTRRSGPHKADRYDPTKMCQWRFETIIQWFGAELKMIGTTVEDLNLS